MYFDSTGGLWVSTLMMATIALGSLLLLLWADAGLSTRPLARLVQTLQQRRRRPGTAPVALRPRPGRSLPRRPAA